MRRCCVRIINLLFFSLPFLSGMCVAVEFLFLLWGIRLCIMVRKAPSEFNESRFISMTIYNEFLLSIFLNVSMFFLQHPANPDLLYIIFFCHSQLTISILLCLIFASKVNFFSCITTVSTFAVIFIKILIFREENLLWRNFGVKN